MSEIIQIRLPDPPSPLGEDLAEYVLLLNRYLRTVTETYNRLLARNLRWQNLRAALLPHTFNAVANTTDTLTHDLGKVPEFFVVNFQAVSPLAAPEPIAYYTAADKAAWTSTTIDLQCNVANAVSTILVM